MCVTWKVQCKGVKHNNLICNTDINISITNKIVVFDSLTLHLSYVEVLDWFFGYLKTLFKCIIYINLFTEKEYSANNISIYCKYKKSLKVTGVVFHSEPSQKVSKLLSPHAARKFCNMWNIAATLEQLETPHPVSNKAPTTHLISKESPTPHLVSNKSTTTHLVSNKSTTPHLVYQRGHQQLIKYLTNHQHLI